MSDSAHGQGEWNQTDEVIFVTLQSESPQLIGCVPDRHPANAIAFGSPRNAIEYANWITPGGTKWSKESSNRIKGNNGWGNWYVHQYRLIDGRAVAYESDIETILTEDDRA